MIWGNIGIGKSEAISQLCKANDWGFKDTRGSQLDPSDLMGLPVMNPQEMKAYFLKYSDILPDTELKNQGILFLDELPQAPDMVKSAMYQLINDRSLGDYKLPENWIVIGAGNREDDGGVYFEMPLALKDRFQGVELLPDYKGFVEYVSNKYRKESALDNMIAYLTYQIGNDKDKIYKPDENSFNFPTFRSWEKALKSVKYGKDEFNAITDNVGDHIAVDYITFKELVREIPNAESLIKSKEYFKDIQKQIVACQKVTKYMLDDMKNATYKSFRYFEDMKNPENEKDMREELTILFLTNLMNDQDVLDNLNEDYIDKKPKNKKEVDLWELIFKKWDIINEI